MMIMTIGDFLGAVGFVTLGVMAVCAVCAIGSWLWGFCRVLYWDARLVYLHSRLHRELTAMNGEYVSRWLINYSQTHGFINGNFTAMEWNKYFAELLRKQE